MRLGKSSSLAGKKLKEGRLLLVLFAILLSVSAAYSLTNGDGKDGKRKPTRPRKLGESISTLRRDPKTGRLVNPTVAAEEASYVDKTDAQAAKPADDDAIVLDSKLFAFELMVQDPANKRYVLDTETG